MLERNNAYVAPYEVQFRCELLATQLPFVVQKLSEWGLLYGQGDFNHCNLPMNDQKYPSQLDGGTWACQNKKSGCMVA